MRGWEFLTSGDSLAVQPLRFLVIGGVGRCAADVGCGELGSGGGLRLADAGGVLVGGYSPADSQI